MNKDALFQKMMKKVRTGCGDAHTHAHADVISIPADVKVDSLQGGDILLVHDVPITKVGVQEYADGKYLKTSEALAGMRTDYSPLVINHPPVFFADMTDEEIKDKAVGYSGDGYFDEAKGKRYANFYLFKDALESTAKGQVILDRLGKKQSTDVSIGFLVEAVKERGVHDGVEYDYKDVTIQHDHTALLPDEVGRWSYPDGVGIGADHAHIAARGASNGDNTRGATMADDNVAKVLEDAKKREDDLRSEAKMATDALAAKEKELADAQKLLKDAAEKEQARLDAEAKADADERKRLSDALVEKFYKSDSDARKEFAAFCNKQDRAGLEYLGRTIEAAAVKDNKLLIPAKVESDRKPDKLRDARDAQMKKIADAQKKA